MSVGGIVVHTRSRYTYHVHFQGFKLQAGPVMFGSGHTRLVGV
jgi:hypothetical protein